MELLKAGILPATKIETDSYVAVQLLEGQGGLSMDGLRQMAEALRGTYTLTVLDGDNTLYFVRGNNPLAIRLYPRLGCYLYASTDEILNALRAGNVKATWFMVEFWAEKYPDYVKKIDGAGHEIGTHSSTHSYMSKQNSEEIKLELSSSSEAIKSVTGKDVNLFRPPYGDYDDELIKTASEQGYYSIQWDVDSLDWKDLSASDIAMRVINSVKNGSIILMHNNGLHTAEAVPIILETLKNRGYTFVPIGELIYKDKIGRAHV